MEKIKSLDLFTKGKINFDGFNLVKDKVNVIASEVGCGKNIIAKTLVNVLNDESTVIINVEYDSADKNSKRIKNVIDDIFAIARLKQYKALGTMFRPIIYFIYDISYGDLIKINKIYDIFTENNVCVVATIHSHEMQSKHSEYNVLHIEKSGAKSDCDNSIRVMINGIEYKAFIYKGLINREMNRLYGMTKYLETINVEQYEKLTKLKGEDNNEELIKELREILKYKNKNNLALNLAEVKTIYEEEGHNYIEFYCI